MFEVRRSLVFEAWLRGLTDKTAAAIVARRIQRVAMGNLGDTRSIGDGVSELPIMAPATGSISRDVATR